MIVKCQVMDYDKFSADDLCGSCTVKVSDLHLGYNACCLETIPALCGLYVVAHGMRHDGWYGKVDLQRPKRTLGGGKDDEHMSLGQQ